MATITPNGKWHLLFDLCHSFSHYETAAQTHPARSAGECQCAALEEGTYIALPGEMSSFNFCELISLEENNF